MSDDQAKAKALEVVRRWDEQDQGFMLITFPRTVTTPEELQDYVTAFWGMTVEQWRNSPGTW